MDNETEIWQCPQCGTEVDISSLGFYAEAGCPACHHAEIVHTVLANFRIDGVLGVGGMSVVLRAHDLVLNRTAAIKVLNETYRNQPERIARFENECAMMARVRHENVVQVYSAGWARGQFYIAMELVEGQNLEHVVTKGSPLDPLTALEITRQVVLGLEAASKSGLLHRDMKPGNIIIDADGRAKVLDFGLSLGQRDADTEEIIWATPFYVSPETLQRKQEDVRTDIYALGMTLRYLLTGVETFADAPQSVSELLQCKFKLPHLSSELPHVAESLCDLVDHMTAYDPADRPEDYRELMAELLEVETAIQKQGAEASPEKCRERRRKILLGAGATIAAGIAVACVTATLSAPDPVRRALPPVEQVSWPEWERFCQARDYLAQKNWVAAEQQFTGLGVSGTAEPGLAAWSALTAASLAAARGDDDAVAVCMEAYHNQLSRSNEQSPAATGLMGQLAACDKLLQQPETDAGDIGLPPLRGMTGYLKARPLALEGKDTAACNAIAQARQDFAASDAPWGEMAALADASLEQLSPKITQGLFSRARHAMVSHDFPAAQSALETYLKRPGLNAAQKDEAQVLQELCQVSAAVVNVFKKRLPQKYSPGMSPSDMRDAIAALKLGHLEDEVYTMALMLQGDYDAAFRANPYRALPASTTPFAILMRDWKSRLGR